MAAAIGESQISHRSRPRSLGGILLRSTVAASGSAVARRNRGMAFEIARAGRFDWGVSAGSSTPVFHWAIPPPTMRLLTAATHAGPAEGERAF